MARQGLLVQRDGLVGLAQQLGAVGARQQGVEVVRGQRQGVVGLGGRQVGQAQGLQDAGMQGAQAGVAGGQGDAVLHGLQGVVRSATGQAGQAQAAPAFQITRGEPGHMAEAGVGLRQVTGLLGHQAEQVPEVASLRCGDQQVAGRQRGAALIPLLEGGDGGHHRLLLVQAAGQRSPCRAVGGRPHRQGCGQRCAGHVGRVGRKAPQLGC